MKLNPEQQQAVESIDRPLLVLAGAGSGKTRVITEKIKYLIHRAYYDPKSIYAVTFTNKAANEMRERLLGTLGREEGRRVRIATFHTLGLAILKRHGEAVGLRKGFSIYDQHDSQHLMESLVNEDVDTAKMVLDQIGHWKNDMLSPNEVLETVSGEFESHAALLYRVYQEQLLSYNAVDFDDLVLQSLQLLQSNETVRDYWRDRIRYLLVDEYQDTNLSQYHLVKALMEGRQTLTVVGDDDQSIYAWRGARPENLNQLHHDFPDIRLIKLEQNYRSTGHILNAANHVISLNPHLYDKKLWSALGEGEKIQIDEFKSAEEEAAHIGATISHNKMIRGDSYSDYAILYRGNHQSRLFEMALRMRNIPVQVVGGQSFFQQQEVKDLLSYLKLIANPEDNASLLRIINIPRREIGAASLKKLTEFATTNELTLYETLDHPHLHSFIGRAIAHRVNQFHQLIESCRQYDHDLSRLFEHLIEEINYEGYLRDSAPSPAAFERKMRNVGSLQEWFQDQHRSLSEILSHLTLISILENDEENQELDAVTLMTLHSAKGLEFPYVFMVGAEEDILPHRNSIDDGMVDEERRLFYVGVTRAQQELNITYCRQRQKYGEWESCRPSRFLSELPKENIQWESEGISDEKDQKENTASTLKGLQNMLSSLER